jgi:hypothetical protein
VTAARAARISISLLVLSLETFRNFRAAGNVTRIFESLLRRLELTLIGFDRLIESNLRYRSFAESDSGVRTTTWRTRTWGDLWTFAFAFAQEEEARAAAQKAQQPLSQQVDRRDDYNRKYQQQ